MCCLLIGFSLRVQHDMCRFFQFELYLHPSLRSHTLRSQCIRDKLILTLRIVTWKWRKWRAELPRWTIAVNVCSRRRVWNWKTINWKFAWRFIALTLEHDKWIVDDDNYNSWFCIDLVFLFFIFCCYLTTLCRRCMALVPVDAADNDRNRCGWWCDSSCFAYCNFLLTPELLLYPLFVV